MKKHLLTLLVLLLLSYKVNAQQQAKYILEGQVLGNAPFLAVKISRNFWFTEHNHATLGTGFGYFPNLPSIPVDATISLGNGNKFFELGAVTDFYIGTPKDGPKFQMSPLIGYKSISQKGVVFRFHFTPTVLGEFTLWGGLSVGGVLR
ncbi:MAG: hypothetical protein U5N85_15040 [Arcicella sp.]|nr:hypothetical protein [Arcicella sp.]